MKTRISVLAISSFLFMGAAYAEDAPAVVTVTANITQRNTACQVTLNKTSINLIADANNMITQGDKATSVAPFSMSVMGVEGNNTCGRRIYDGKIAVRFVGTHDSVEGNVFANKANGDDAATGIGIALYKSNNEPVDINQPYHFTMKANVVTEFFGLQLVKLNGQSVTQGAVTGDITAQIERL